MIAYKSVETDMEIEEAKTAIKILGGEITKIIDVSFEDTSRTLIVINKKFKIF